MLVTHGQILVFAQEYLGIYEAQRAENKQANKNTWKHYHLDNSISRLLFTMLNPMKTSIMPNLESLVTIFFFQINYQAQCYD